MTRSQRPRVDLSRSIEVFCGEHSDRNLAFAFGVDALWFDIKDDSYASGDGRQQKTMVRT